MKQRYTLIVYSDDPGIKPLEVQYKFFSFMDSPVEDPYFVHINDFVAIKRETIGGDTYHLYTGEVDDFHVLGHTHLIPEGTPVVDEGDFAPHTSTYNILHAYFNRHLEGK